MRNNETITITTEVCIVADQVKELQDLKAQIRLMKQLVTRKGFYSFYFSKLPNYQTAQQCFENVNYLYHSLFGEKRFSTYDSFKSNILA